MSVPTLSASHWDNKTLSWIVPRNIYLVWWLSSSGIGIDEKYVVADTATMARAKAKRKWGKQMATGHRPGVKLLIAKGHKSAPYAPPKVHLK